jgi:hypothetical protein
VICDIIASPSPPEHDMDKLAIPHGAFVFVGDGRKALFLRNDVTRSFPT